MVELGKYAKLKVLRTSDFGIFLEGTDEGILLPKRYVPEGTQVNDILDVFIYRDSEDRIIATTLIPYASAGDIAYLKVIAVNEKGAFLDWGLPKDLLVPFREQKHPMVAGKKYIVKVYLDNLSQRIVATTKVGKYVSNVKMDLKVGQEVDLIVYGYTEIGSKVIINNQHWGLIYQDWIFRKLDVGDRLKGYVKAIRPENKVDISLQKKGYSEVEDASGKILEKLNENNGFLALTDKSPADKIYAQMQISKSIYKQAVGGLYKKRMIELKENGIYLIKKA